jgi:hypothetical protein
MNRQLAFVAVFTVGLPSAVFAQDRPRFQVGPVARIDKVSLEAGAGASVFSAGAAAELRIFRGFGVEGEITQASGDIGRSYEGWFVSFNQDRNATRAEIEALAPTARRTLGYTPGLGWAAALVIRGGAGRRVTMAARAGLSARRYDETSTFTVLNIPAGVDPAWVDRQFIDSATSRTRGGLLVGVDAAIAVTDRLSIVPEVRYVYSGPAQVGNKYREFGFGTRAMWRF